MAVNIPQALIGGVEIRRCSTLTEPLTEEVQRTWKERLFSRPWRPLKKVKYVTKQVPSRQIVRLGNVFYAHPEVIAEIRAAVDKQKG